MPVLVVANYPFYQFIAKATPLEYGLYDPFSRIAWSIAVCYIIFACTHNSGGLINDFLSLRMWQPLSRLSYAIYLVHGPIITLTLYSIKIPQNFSEMSAFGYLIFIFVLAAFIAIPLTLAFELPIDAINKPTIHQKEKNVSQPQINNINMAPMM